MKIRCSSLGKIMTRPRSKSEVLSQTAKSYIREIAKQDFFGYETDIDNKYIKKGIAVEHLSTELYNEVFNTEHIAGISERIENDYITGECDIETPNTIIDIKSSWSLETFPALPEDADVKNYEHQVRGYMWIYEKPFSEVAFCMVDTPDDLLSDWDNKAIHHVNSIEPSARVTVVKFERDLAWEQECKERCESAQEYYKEYINQLNNKNK